jgi:hypothetical protein
MRQKKQDLTEQRIIAYIDDLLHSCIPNPALHKIKDCKGRDEQVKNFLSKYGSGRWVPTAFGAPSEYDTNREEMGELTNDDA